MPLAPKRTAPLTWNGEFRTNARLMVDCPRYRVSGSRRYVRLTAEIIFGTQNLGSIPFDVEVEGGASTSTVEAKRELHFHTMGEHSILLFSARVGTTAEVDLEVAMIKKEVDLDPPRAENKVKVEERASARPEDFFTELAHAATQDARVFHFVGHGANSGEGLVWESGARRRGEGPILGENFIGAFGDASTVECVFLNACCTLPAGLALMEKRGTHVRYVVCWHGEVFDADCREFAQAFYRAAFPRKGPPLYFAAFVAACRLLDEQYKSKQDLRPSPYLVWCDDASDHALLHDHGHKGTATWVLSRCIRWENVAADGEDAWQGMRGGVVAVATPAEEAEERTDKGEARNWLPHSKVGKVRRMRW